MHPVRPRVGKSRAFSPRRSGQAERAGPMTDSGLLANTVGIWWICWYRSDVRISFMLLFFLSLTVFLTEVEILWEKNEKYNCRLIGFETLWGSFYYGRSNWKRNALTQHENYRAHRNHRREPSWPPEPSDSEVHVLKPTSTVFALFRLVYLSKQGFNHNLKKNPMKGKKSKIREETIF